VTTGRSSVPVDQGWTSQQQGDQDRLTYSGSIASVAVAPANFEAQQAQVRRLEQLTGFERVVAPFDGVITSRQVDIGNLINAGSGSCPELFRVADTSKLRIYVQVPQSYAASQSTRASTSICDSRDIPGAASRRVSSAAPMQLTSHRGPQYARVDRHSRPSAAAQGQQARVAECRS
jgi:multidrug efflux pump subunit AcrA (membrane-fusion protein)